MNAMLLGFDLVALAVLGFTGYLVWTALPFPPLPWVFGIPGVVLAALIHGVGEYLTSPGDPKRFGEP